MHSAVFVRLAGLQVAVTVFLIIVPSISATPSRATVQRDEPKLPPDWTSIGCYTDSLSPALTASFYMDPFNLTVESCVSFCNGRNFIYAGVGRGTDCYCGNVLTPGTSQTSSSDCNSTCTGNPKENCGGPESLGLYQNNGNTPPPQSVAVENIDSWYHVGCFSDANDARTLRLHATVMGGPYNNTVENCLMACEEANYSLAGVEFASQCWCGNTIQNGGEMMDPANCNLACTGDSSELCGGADCYNLYSNIK